MSQTQIQTTGIADDAVTAAKIAAGAVGTTEISANAVTATQIAAGAITTAKIADDSYRTSTEGIRVVNSASDTQFATEKAIAVLAANLVTTEKVLNAIAVSAVQSQGIVPVGVYAFLGRTISGPNNFSSIGLTRPGSDLSYASSVNGTSRTDIAAAPPAGGGNGVGTWMCMGRMDNNTSSRLQMQTLWLRVA
jgi:hypothetical protein